MSGTGEEVAHHGDAGIDRRYTMYLIVAAPAGWALASYDLNLLTLTLPDTREGLGLSSFLVGALQRCSRGLNLGLVAGAGEPAFRIFGSGGSRRSPHRLHSCPAEDRSPCSSGRR